MVQFSLVCLGALVASSADAFVGKSSVPHQQSASSTSLHALFTPPTMIIGPMIRKMREENAKKRMPMTSRDEAKSEAPGLRVGVGAWKWPAVWPYDSTFFTPKDDIPQAAPDIVGLTGLLTGGTPTPAVPEVDEESKFDPLQYWGEEKADATTDLHPDAVEKLRR